VTDEQLLAILKDEQSRSELKSFPGNANQATCVKAMRRAYDLGRKQEAAMWELASESQRLGLQ
jgi:hypothetical protein